MTDDFRPARYGDKELFEIQFEPWPETPIDNSPDERRRYKNAKRRRNYIQKKERDLLDMTTNAARQKAHRESLKTMVKHGVRVKYRGMARHKTTKVEWKITAHWPDHGYFEFSRTYSHESGREYTKTILVSKKVREKNYEDIR